MTCDMPGGSSILDLERFIEEFCNTSGTHCLTECELTSATASAIGSSHGALVVDQSATERSETRLGHELSGVPPFLLPTRTSIFLHKGLAQAIALGRVCAMSIAVDQ